MTSRLTSLRTTSPDDSQPADPALDQLIMEWESSTKQIIHSSGAFIHVGLIHLLISLTTIESLGRICTFAFPNLSPTVIRIKLRFCGQTYVYSAPAVNKSATGKKRVCRCPHELHSNLIVAATTHHPFRRNLS